MAEHQERDRIARVLPDDLQQLLYGVKVQTLMREDLGQNGASNCKSGIELVRQIQERRPRILRLVLSGHLSSVYVEDARAAGAKAYVGKRQLEELIAVLRLVLDGGSRFPQF